MKNIDLIYNKSCIVVLKVFFNNKKTLNYKEIQQQTKQSKVTLLKSLNDLCNFGLISKEKKGNAYFYSIIESEAYFMLKKSYYILFYTYLLKDLKTDNLEIYLFGSYAKATSDKYSDIDLLVISKDKKIVNIVDSKIKHLYLPTNIIHKTPLEYASMIKDSKAFYIEFEKSKVRLI